MKSIIVFAILTLCVVAVFQFLSRPAGKLDAPVIESGIESGDTLQKMVT